MVKTTTGYVLTDFCQTVEELEDLLFWFVLGLSE